MVQFGRKVLDRLNSHPVSRLRAAKGLSRSADRCFAALSMTGLDLSVGEELSSAFEPCLSGQMVIIPCQNIDSYDDGYCSPSFTVVGSPANEYRRSCLYCPPGHTRNGLPRQTIAGYACYY